MTTNQIEYWRNKENERHNKEQEYIGKAQAAAASAQAQAANRQAAVQEALLASSIEKALASAAASRAQARASEATAEESPYRKISSVGGLVSGALGTFLGSRLLTEQLKNRNTQASQAAARARNAGVDVAAQQAASKAATKARVAKGLSTAAKGAGVLGEAVAVGLMAKSDQGPGSERVIRLMSWPQSGGTPFSQNIGNMLDASELQTIANKMYLHEADEQASRKNYPTLRKAINEYFRYYNQASGDKMDFKTGVSQIFHELEEM